MHNKEALQTEMEQQEKSRFEELLANQPDSYTTVLTASWIATPLGSMVAIADDDHIRMLSFIETSSLERKAEQIGHTLSARIEMGTKPVLSQIADELAAYYDGTLRDFNTPTLLTGSGFQLSVWDELRKIPYGNTISYSRLAENIGKPASFRAVAQANSQNPIAIVVPDHRAVNADGRLGGSAGGMDKRKWLLDFKQEVLGDDDE